MLRSLKELVKNTVAEALYRTGLLRLLLAARFRKRAAILMYHRVLPEGAEADSFTADSIRVTPQEFDWQMETVGRYMLPTSLAALQRAIADETAVIPSRTCVVTFDDGWFDNSAHAVPILVKRGVPATIFVATHYIGSGECFWQEKLTRLLHEAARHPALGAALLPSVNAEHLASAPRNELRHAAREVVTALKSKAPQEIRDLVTKAAAIAGEHGVDARRTGDDRFMTWDDVVSISRTGLVDVMSHAVSHAPLDRLTAEQALQELTESRAAIESRTGATVEALAYPNGNFNEVVVDSARRAGYRIALTTMAGAAGKHDDPLRLPRINIQSSAARTPARFLCRIAGLF